MTTLTTIAVCPQCHQAREIKGNTAPTYERLCRRCNAKQSATRRKVDIVMIGSTPQEPSKTTIQAPCKAGKAHHWYIPNGRGSEYCKNGCGQKMAPERWADIPTGPQGLLEHHALMPAWDLKPVMEVNSW